MHSYHNQHNISTTHVDRSTYVDTANPYSIPIPYVPEHSVGMSQDAIRIIITSFRGALQLKADQGNPLLVYSFNLMSESNFNNDLYNSALEGLFELLSIDVISASNLDTVLINAAVSNTIDAICLQSINRQPQLAQYVQQSDLERAKLNVKNAFDLVRTNNQSSNMFNRQNNNLLNQPTVTMNNHVNNQPQHGLTQLNNQHGFNSHQGHHNQIQQRHNNFGGNFNQGNMHQQGHQNHLTNDMSNNDYMPFNPLEDISDIGQSIDIEPEVSVNELHAEYYKAITPEQQQMVRTHFNGGLPNDVTVFPRQTFAEDGMTPITEYLLLFPSSTFSALPDTKLKFKETIKKGESAIHYVHPPLARTDREALWCTVSAEGDREYVLIKSSEEEMNIDEHVPAGASIEWNSLNRTPILDADGKEISAGAYIEETPIVGTASRASANANYAMRAVSGGKIDLDRVVEYRVHDNSAFFVDDVKNVIGVLGKHRNVTSLPTLLKAIMDSKSITPKMSKYLDVVGTKLINDYVKYSLGIGITVDSLFEDLNDLISDVREDYGNEYVALLENGYPEIAKKLCTAIKSKADDTYIEHIAINEKGEEDKALNARLMASIVLLTHASQITELPVTFEGLNIDFQVEEDGFFNPRGTISDTQSDIYKAVHSVYTRDETTRIREYILETSDGIRISIHKSGHDESYVLVKEN